MGIEIDRESFNDEDYARFSHALRGELDALKRVVGANGFGEGPPSIGLELELNLVNAEDGRGRPGSPAFVNREVLAETVDPRVTLEVDRFNLEINTLPEALAGAPFSALSRQLGDALGETSRAARLQGARVAAIGILPTLVERDLQAGALTEQRRYRALSAGIKRIRGEAFPVEIRGEESLSVVADDVTFEGANTSLQVHLRTTPAAFARHFNAAQAVTGPLLAVSCNSPLFLGQRLWQETRVALFRQSVDDRQHALYDDWRPARVSFGHGWVREGAHELFAESVALHEPLLPVLADEDVDAALQNGHAPKLANLRLHHGTVWRWNRAVYDHAGGGHLRIELRALPAGPTVLDMLGNAALAVGLTLGIAPEIDGLLNGLTFGHARRNFYQAARFGLDAELVWPDLARGAPRTWRVAELLDHLLPLAERGLCEAGVNAAEAARWLGIVERRARRGVTGASWQRRVFDRLLLTEPRDRACLLLLQRYLELAERGEPLYAWPEA